MFNVQWTELEMEMELGPGPLEDYGLPRSAGRAPLRSHGGGLYLTRTTAHYSLVLLNARYLMLYLDSMNLMFITTSSISNSICLLSLLAR